MNTCTAALVTEPVLVPRSAARTLAIVAASTSNEESTSRIDWTCEDESPDALAVGAATTGVTTGAVGVAVGASDVTDAAGVVDVVELPPPLLELLELLELAGVTTFSELPPPPPEQMSDEDAVMVKVTVEVGSYLMND